MSLTRYIDYINNKRRGIGNVAVPAQITVSVTDRVRITDTADKTLSGLLYYLGSSRLGYAVMRQGTMVSENRLIFKGQTLSLSGDILTL